MKKQISAFLSLVMILLLSLSFSACGENENAGRETPNGNQSLSSEKIAEDAAVVIKEMLKKSLGSNESLDTDEGISEFVYANFPNSEHTQKMIGKLNLQFDLCSMLISNHPEYKLILLESFKTSFLYCVETYPEVYADGVHASGMPSKIKVKLSSIIDNEAEMLCNADYSGYAKKTGDNGISFGTGNAAEFPFIFKNQNEDGFSKEFVAEIIHSDDSSHIDAVYETVCSRGSNVINILSGSLSEDEWIPLEGYNFEIK